MSEKLTPERIAEIMALPVVYDEDCPKLTKEQLAELRPAHPENFVKGTHPLSIGWDFFAQRGARNSQ